MGGHALVVGGAGMLSGVVRRLLADGWQVSALSRRASLFAAELGGAISGYDCDYHDAAAFESALDEACRAQGPIALGVAWFHTLKIQAPRRLAERIGDARSVGRLVQVLGSAMADPARPDRLATAAQVAEGLGSCRLSQVVLGFVGAPEGPRWLSHDEISQGVLAAIDTGEPLSFVGQTRPWSARPAV
jgi:uncharacterized protein YbjT (DUF2867 family)